MDFKQFAYALKNAKDIRLLNLALRQYLSYYKIKTFSYTYYAYHPNSQHKLKYDYSSENFSSWHQHYIEEGYEDIDSTLVEEHRSILPLYWNTKDQLANAKSPRERQMRLDAIQFGAVQGLSVPIYGPSEDFANLLVVQMKGEDCLENWQDLQYELHTTAYFYHHYLKQHLLQKQMPNPSYRLTEREMQCLLLTAKQEMVPAIAKSLKITERTVNFHLQKINKKLGTRNKYQSVAKALKKGLLTL